MLALFQVNTPPPSTDLEITSFSSCQSVKLTHYTQATGQFCHIHFTIIISIHSTCYKDLVAKQHAVLTSIMGCDVFPQPVPYILSY